MPMRPALLSTNRVDIPTIKSSENVETPLIFALPVTTNPAPSNVKLALSSSSPSVPARTTRLSVKSSTFALPVTKAVPAVTTPTNAAAPLL